MKLLAGNLVLLICCLFQNDTFALQQPGYFVLGEQTFSGVQIYDVIQDHQFNYWFSTSEGLYKYDHYDYEKIACDESKSISFFNFVISKNGTIYCNNLNNQIFEIKNNTCKLFYELDLADTHSDLHLITGENNELFITAGSIIVLDADGKEINRFNTEKFYYGTPFYLNEKSILFPVNSNSIIVFKENHFEKKQLVCQQKLELSNSVHQFIKLADKIYALDLKSKNLYLFNPDDFSMQVIPSHPYFKRSESVRIYSTGNHLWVAGTLPGVGLIESDFSNEPNTLFYKQFLISDVYEDQEGNILLSTFDHGVLVIPDLKVPDVIQDFNFESATAIEIDSLYGAIFGTSTGQLVKYSGNNFTTIHESGKRSIDCLVNDANSDYIIFDDGEIRAFNKISGKIIRVTEASLKDGIYTDKNTAYLSTNLGLMKVSFINDQLQTEWIPFFKIRNYAIEFNPVSKSICIATVKGLFVLDSNEQTKEITHEGDPVFANSITASQNQFYVSVANDGLLVLNEDGSVKEIALKKNDKTINTYKLLIYKNTIIAHTDEGLLQFDQHGNFLKHLDNLNGRLRQRVLDFKIAGDKIWVSTPDGIRIIKLTDAMVPPPIPIIRITNLLVDDQYKALTGNANFNYHNRKFEFVLSSPTLRYQNEIKYHYRLIGYDENWTIHSYDDHKIIYNALSPGEYTFQVKAENQNQFSEVISYSFKIHPPFYTSWWFIAMMILIFLIVVYFIYRRQLGIHQQKAKQINELNASKLTAIQSQMNPHFIFNSLNSIQDLVLKGDVENSYTYITTFSNLVRRTLNYSDKEFIDFEQEIKLIELYLSLEKLRFKSELEYQIHTNNISDILIPPMLIQPFIENALVHGLLQKKGNKKLSIRFELNEHLTCTIEDNGIGREEAEKISKRQKREHESFAVEAIQKRFDILKNLYQGSLGYRYENVMENNLPAGTRVILTIPVKHKF